MNINIYEPQHFKMIRYFLTTYTIVVVLLIIFLNLSYLKEILGLKNKYVFRRFRERQFGFIYTALALALLLGVQYKHNPIIYIDFKHTRADLHLEQYADTISFINENTETILLNENDPDDLIPYREADQSLYQFMKYGSEGTEVLDEKYIDAITIWNMPFDENHDNFKNTLKLVEKEAKFINLFGLSNTRSFFNSNNILLIIKSIFLLIFPFSIKSKES